jgi:tetratricopeptide (TPR) repeat protein
MTVDDVRDFLRLLGEHPEWRAELRRLVLAEDVLALPQLVRALAEAQGRTEEAVARLAEAQARTEERVGRLEEAVARLDLAVARLAEAQARTEERVGRLEEAVARLDLAVARLAEAQARTEERVGRLEEAVARLDLAVARLAEAQARTEEAVAELARQVGGLSETVGGDIEDIAYIVLHDVLGREFGWQVGVLERSWQRWNGKPEEVNIFGQARDPARPERTIWIVGEAKHNLTLSEVERFARQVERARRHLVGEVFAVCFCYRARPEVRERLQELGIPLVFSYGRLA